MNIYRENKEFYVIGKKYTGKFEDYPMIIPEAKEDFKKDYEKIVGSSRFTRAIVYEPKRSENHTIGYFHLGALVHEDFQAELPSDMKKLYLTGDFIFTSDIFDVSRMGEFYTALDNWFIGREEQVDLGHELIEIYYPRDDSQEQLEVYMRIKD